MNNTGWKQARKKANLEHVRVHDLKHTYGRRLFHLRIGRTCWVINQQGLRLITLLQRFLIYGRRQIGFAKSFVSLR